MKAGLTIEELATEVMRQKDAKADYIVNTSMLAMEHCGTGLYFRGIEMCSGVNSQSAWWSKNCMYETPYCVTGAVQLTGL